MCALIRGKGVNQALATLQFTRKTLRANWPRCCARPWPTRSRKTVSAAMSSGCTSRHATRTGPSMKRASGTHGSRVPGHQTDGASTVEVAERPSNRSRGRGDPGRSRPGAEDGRCGGDRCKEDGQGSGREGIGRVIQFTDLRIYELTDRGGRFGAMRKFVNL